MQIDGRQFAEPRAVRDPITARDHDDEYGLGGYGLVPYGGTEDTAPPPDDGNGDEPPDDGGDGDGGGIGLGTLATLGALGYYIIRD